MVSSLTKVTTVTSSIIKGIQKWKVNSYLFIYFFEKEVKTNFNIPGKPDSRLSQPSLLDWMNTAFEGMTFSKNSTRGSARGFSYSK